MNGDIDFGGKSVIIEVLIINEPLPVPVHLLIIIMKTEFLMRWSVSREHERYKHGMCD